MTDSGTDTYSAPAGRATSDRLRHLGERVLKGRVGFNTSPGAGTTFYITLPRAGNRSAAPAR